MPICYEEITKTKNYAFKCDIRVFTLLKGQVEYYNLGYCINSLFYHTCKIWGRASVLYFGKK